MKNYAKTHDTANRESDLELAETLAAISAVSRRLARKLIAASRQNLSANAEYECPYLRQERMKRNEALRNQ